MCKLWNGTCARDAGSLLRCFQLARSLILPVSIPSRSYHCNQQPSRNTLDQCDSCCKKTGGSAVRSFFLSESLTFSYICHWCWWQETYSERIIYKMSLFTPVSKFFKIKLKTRQYSICQACIIRCSAPATFSAKNSYWQRLTRKIKV